LRLLKSQAILCSTTCVLLAWQTFLQGQSHLREIVMTDDWKAIDILLEVQFLHHGHVKESPRETAATYHHATLTHIDHRRSTTEGMMVFVGTNQYAGQIMIRDSTETGILGGGMNEIVLGIRDQARIMTGTADHTIWTETTIGEEVSSNFGVASYHFFLSKSRRHIDEAHPVAALAHHQGDVPPHHHTTETDARVVLSGHLLQESH
jgi:hypothetical protein